MASQAVDTSLISQLQVVLPARCNPYGPETESTSYYPVSFSSLHVTHLSPRINTRRQVVCEVRDLYPVLGHRHFDMEDGPCSLHHGDPSSSAEANLELHFTVIPIVCACCGSLVRLAGLVVGDGHVLRFMSRLAGAYPRNLTTTRILSEDGTSGVHRGFKITHSRSWDCDSWDASRS